MNSLPARRAVRIVTQRAGTFDEKLLRGQDAVIIACDRERAQRLLAGLPFAGTWRRLYREALARGQVNVLSARIVSGTGAANPGSLAMALVFVKRTASAFEQLSLAARACKQIAAAAERRVLIGTLGIETPRAASMNEALLAATLAAGAPMPTGKSKPARPPALETITLIQDGAALDVQRTVAIDRGNHLARWLTTLPPNVLDCSAYRNALRTLAQRHGWAFRFFNEAALERLGAGAFLAVARANAHRDAGIVRLQYRPRRRRGGKAPAVRLALVGKGIAFDTGGINLKSHKGMYHMHEDMQGSAVAVGTLLALSELGVPYEIDCWLAITENEIGPRAYRPQEVVTAANGTTIQVVHSDAEGRMALADTLALAARERPDLIIDFATLTGACVTALTERYSGAFTNRPEWHAALELAGRHSGERVWPFPMDEDYESDLESPIADILQCAIDGKGDHILAARFLNRFVPAEIPWIHLDLAASNRSGGLAHIPTDFTGFGVRYTTHLLLDQDLLRARPRKDGNESADLANGRRSKQ